MSSNENESELISQFMGLTGADEERARFFLESSAWQYQVAVASFFDEDEAPMDQSSVPLSGPPQPQEGGAPAGPTLEGSSTDGGPSHQPHRPPKHSSKIATIGDLRGGEQGGDDDEEEGQRFYAGGSDHGSGQQVVGPSKKKIAENMVQDLFKSAREHGAEEVSHSGAPGTSGQGTFAFRGAGYRLGESADEAVRPVPGTVGTMPVKEKHMVLKLWKDGFSVDDGPLRDFRKPENAEFLKSVKKGEIPMELIRNAPGGEVNLDLEDHKDEEFKMPRTQRKAFVGKGYKLGNITPTFKGEGALAAALPTVAPPADPGATWEVDASQPVTTLQLRLGDGSRLVGKFNHTHSIADIRRFISVSRPEYAAATYKLMTTFPNKVLDDDSKAIAEANLLNAVITQRLT